MMNKIKPVSLRIDLQFKQFQLLLIWITTLAHFFPETMTISTTTLRHGKDLNDRKLNIREKSYFHVLQW